MIQHIVFDFGGVILDLDGVHTGYPDNLAVIFGTSVQDAVELWNLEKTSVITGNETPKEFLERMKQERGYSFDVTEGLAYWEAQNVIQESRIDWELMEWINKLRSHYKVHMLTDQIQLKNGAAAWIDKVESSFSLILRSHEQGYRKPFPKAYENLLVKINAESDPGSVVFIDDNLENVEAAKHWGIHTILYTFRDHEGLKQKLNTLGVQI